MWALLSTQVALHGFTKVQQQHMIYTHSLMSFQILYLKHFCVAYVSVCHQSKGSLTFLLEGPSSGPFQAAFVTPCYPPPTKITPTIMTPSLLPWTVHSNATQLPIEQFHKVCTHTALRTCWTCFIEGTQGSCTLSSSLTPASCSQITWLPHNLHWSGFISHPPN